MHTQTQRTRADGRAVLRRAGAGDTGAAAELSDRPADARQALNDAWAGLQATHLDAQILSSKYAEDTGSVTYRYTWHLPKDRTWTYDGQLNMVRDEGRWEVRWSATGVHPKLGENQTLRTARRPAPAGLGQRTRRHRRAGARLPVQLLAGRPGRGRLR